MLDGTLAAAGGVDLGSADPLQVILTSAVAIAGSYLLYRGTRRQADTAQQASTSATRVDEQESALQAWKDLLAPLQQQVAVQAQEIAADRATRKKEREEWEAREAEILRRQERLSAELAAVRRDLGHWKRMAKAIAKWALALRDQVIALGGNAPSHPEELLLMQAVTSGESADWLLDVLPTVPPAEELPVEPGRHRGGDTPPGGGGDGEPVGP